MVLFHTWSRAMLQNFLKKSSTTTDILGSLYLVQRWVAKLRPRYQPLWRRVWILDAVLATTCWVLQALGVQRRLHVVSCTTMNICSSRRCGTMVEQVCGLACLQRILFGKCSRFIEHFGTSLPLMFGFFPYRKNMHG